MKSSWVPVEVEYCLKLLYYMKLPISLEEPFAVVESEVVTVIAIIVFAELTSLSRLIELETFAVTIVCYFLCFELLLLTSVVKLQYLYH